LADAEIGPKFIDAITKIVEIITELTNSPAVDVFFSILNFLLDVAKWVVSNPILGTLLASIASGFAAIAAVSLFSQFTGITALIGWLLRLAKGGGGLPGLLKRIGGGFAGLGGAGAAAGAAGAAGAAAGTRRGPGGGSAGRTSGVLPFPNGRNVPSGRRGAGAGAGALGLGAGFVSAFTGNMALLETQFYRTGAAKDAFIRNLQLLATQFGITGGAAAGAGGSSVVAAGETRKSRRQPKTSFLGKVGKVGGGLLGGVLSMLSFGLIPMDLFSGSGGGAPKTEAAPGSRRAARNAAPKTGLSAGLDFIANLGKKTSTSTAANAGKGFNLMGSIAKGAGIVMDE